MATISFSGLASGIDGDAVIKAILDSRRTVTLPLKAKQEDNDKESKALEELNTKLLSMRSLLDGFLTLSGGGVSKKAVSSSEDSVSAVASTGAAASNISVSVSSLAKGATFSFNDRFASIDAPIAPNLSAPVDLKLTVGSGESSTEVTVSISNTTTLNELAAAINTASGGTLQASTVNVGTTVAPQNLLLISTTATGVEKGSLAVTVPPELSGTGIFGSSTLDQAQDAVFSVSGIGQVSRATNNISDLIPGVTLQLKKANTGLVNIAITNDGQRTAESFQKFIEAFNELITSLKPQNAIERIENSEGVTNSFGPLARTQVDNNLLGDIRAAMGSISAGAAGTSINVLADLGVTIQRDGTYAFDQKKFTDAVSKEPAAVQKITSSLADRLATTDGVLSVYTSFQGQIDLAQKGNEEESKGIAQKLESLERSFAQQEESMKKTFATLESTISRLNSESSALVAMLQSVQSGR